ncbi:hypothetical protein PUR71_14855 [Streptomyces sp. SP17BM10]|uniref:hypothetical protein n=1 Tax=Streptomyces sp. SP17BM10 TaxID=3002530 RepID=UPI002E768CD2|nr:hypothetical protein [Streptomyces sp. SP17BM10]MEE1784167.1 hypothetical protein [Streptomyces sp. SP17BM10]
MTEEAALDPQPADRPKPKRAVRLRVCDWCSTPFVPENKRGPAPKYCKQGCRQRAHEARKRRDEIDAINDRHEQQLNRIFGALGKNTASKARKAADEAEAEQAGPGPVIEGQEELTW